MSSLQEHIADSLFSEPEGNVDFSISISAIEIAGSKCFGKNCSHLAIPLLNLKSALHADLLRNRQKVMICDDENGSSKLLNITERVAASSCDIIEIIREALAERTTESTAVNSVSSRSHFVCSIKLIDQNQKKSKTVYGEITLLDLAGRYGI